MSLLSRLGLRKPQPVRLATVINDPVLGDMDHARALLRGDIVDGGERFTLRGGDWAMRGASDEFQSHVHGFHWLRDLAIAVPHDRGAEFAGPILDGWFATFEEKDEMAWRADRCGARLAFWTLYAPYVLGAQAERRRAALAHMVQATAQIDRKFMTAPVGLPRIRAAAGAIIGALSLEGGGGNLKRAEKRLMEAADLAVLPHGLPASRVPADLLSILEWVHMVRAAYEANGEMWPVAQQALDGRIRAGIRAARLGDGRLTAIHGGNPASLARIDHVLAWPGMADRSAGAGVESGLQRMELGRTILLMDAGPPPEVDQNPVAHAGVLAFEMSDENERVIVNCGGGRGTRKAMDSRLAAMVRLTAAHSTLTLADSNQSVIEDGEPLGAGVVYVEVERDENEQGAIVDASHDGYLKRFGLSHVRRLFLSADGRDLRGEDRLEPKGGKARKREHDLAVRFHLAPGIDITPTADERGAVLRLPSGALWQLKTDRGTVSVDDSLWIGEEGRPRRTRQIVISGRTGPDGWQGRWSFKKMG